MLVQAERQPTFVESPESLELMPSYQARALIETSEWPLRYDEEYRTEFYTTKGVVRTELQPGTEVNGHKTWYKDERVQKSGSYKSRGATHGVAGHQGEVAVTYSTGNHAYSVALAAEKEGCAGTHIEGTRGMSSFKIDLIKPTGASLNTENEDFPTAQKAAEDIAMRPGYFNVPPFGSPDVIAGQCTLGEEVVEDIIALGLAFKTVVIPVSLAGGGQLVGYALPIRRAQEEGRIGPNVRVVGVQPEGTDTMRRALHNLRNGLDATDLYMGETQDTKCDALVVGEKNLNAITASIIADPDYVLDIVTVSDLHIAQAIDSLEQELGGSVEPAAALTQALVESFTAQGSTLPAEERPVFIIPVSGGNKSPKTAAAYRRIERAAVQVRFQAQSRAYAERGGSPESELRAIQAAELAEERAIADGTQAPRDDDTTNLRRRRIAHALYGGAAAAYLRGPVQPH